MDETRVHIRNRLTKECGGEWEKGRGGEEEKNATDKAGA
jgi:hypothetical protein